MIGLHVKSAFAAIFAVTSIALQADTLDLLLPKPVKVEQLAGSATAEVCANVKVVKGSVPGAPSAVAAEAYVLEVSKNGVTVTASDSRGERYARTTLDQLMKLGNGSVPCCRIIDWPAFRWRGFMNDCGRNYLEMEGVKAILDVMALYKMNLFHWHLTDYHGWRLESKKYPCLQRPEVFLRQKGRYYTQEQFKEIVAYAAERGIT
ncbi:MAG: family 20 glycosylhydrolase, partial [Kiritimatiellae bacterium]|nr:family 20 glycosylhydrolase [Kiritimatiellia bacterium]